MALHCLWCSVFYVDLFMILILTKLNTLSETVLEKGPSHLLPAVQEVISWRRGPQTLLKMSFNIQRSRNLRFYRNYDICFGKARTRFMHIPDGDAHSWPKRQHTAYVSLVFSIFVRIHHGSVLFPLPLLSRISLLESFKSLCHRFCFMQMTARKSKGDLERQARWWCLALSERKLNREIEY